jgi:hypothetical protein
MINEYLRFIFKSPESSTVNDSVTVTLKSRATIAKLLLVASPFREMTAGGITGKIWPFC